MTNKVLDLIDPYNIARYIKDANKSTPIKAYVNGDLKDTTCKNAKIFGNDHFWVIIGENSDITAYLKEHANKISYYHIENDRRNSAIPMLDLTEINARIEPGAIIRDRVKIHKQVIVMMGAVINIGCEIGEATMIDMNAVLGARVTVGKNCHVGAGAVLAGVLEPPSATPVIIEDDVMIGANAVVLEGVKIGEGAVVAAGAIVTKDVPAGCVVAGCPGTIIKRKDAQTIEKTKLLEDLR